MEMFEEAGVPPGVLNFLPGHGSVIGAAYWSIIRMSIMIAFTGSREVGLRIWESAGKTRPGQRELKRVVCEMGGKNAIIVDSDADLDEAIVDSIYSAFGYQGQKCSALSRLIVLEENYDRVMERLLAAAASLRVGNPEEPGITVGPVIDEAAYKRILEIHRDRQERGDARLSGERFAAAGLLHSADHFHRCETTHAHRARRDFRPGLERDQSARSG